MQELGGGVQYELPLCGSSGDAVYDLMVGRYLMLGLINEEKPIDFDAKHLGAVLPQRIFAVSVDRYGRALLSLALWAMSFKVGQDILVAKKPHSGRNQ